ncbi:MAG: serine--tRNA ligase, partial [Planctomycetota bacterium]
DAFLAIDERSRELRTRWVALRARQTMVGGEAHKLPADKKETALAALAGIKNEIKALEEELPALEKKRDEMADLLPNPPAPEVPEGKDDTENVELYRVGKPPVHDFEVLDHVNYGLKHNLVDFERASRIAGSRTYFLKNEAAILDISIQRMALDLARARGFTPMVAPMIVRREAMYGTAYFPGGEEQAYAMEKDESWLIGTSEVPVTSYHSGEILEERDLPIRMAGISSCFRREAGAAGKDTRGLYRIHQFNKIEQVIIGKNDDEASKQYHQEILKNSEDLLQLLELPYRVVNVCGGDLGQGQIQKFDIETWMPSRGGYGETHSASRFHEFQSRRLNLRYRDADGTLRFCHTLNNTLIATPRVLIPLLECHQQKDGSVRIPKALAAYTGFDRIPAR